MIFNFVIFRYDAILAIVEGDQTFHQCHYALCYKCVGHRYKKPLGRLKSSQKVTKVMIIETIALMLGRIAIQSRSTSTMFAGLYLNRTTLY